MLKFIKMFRKIVFHMVVAVWCISVRESCAFPEVLDSLNHDRSLPQSSGKPDPFVTVRLTRHLQEAGAPATVVAPLSEVGSLVAVPVKAAAAPESDEEEEERPVEIRTATGGLINTVMITLTMFAFAGNAMFLVYVFWLSK